LLGEPALWTYKKLTTNNSDGKCKLKLSVDYYLTLTLLTSTKWWAPASAGKWQMGFNSAFKGLSIKKAHFNRNYGNNK
jgi:hypothetical protein